MKCPNTNTEEFSSLKNEKEELYFYFKSSYGDVINKKNSLGFYIQGLKEIKPNQYEFNGNKNLLLQLLKLNKIKFNIENDIIKTPTSTIILLDKKEKIKSINLEEQLVSELKENINYDKLDRLNEISNFKYKNINGLLKKENYSNKQENTIKYNNGISLVKEDFNTYIISNNINNNLDLFKKYYLNYQDLNLNIKDNLIKKFDNLTWERPNNYYSNYDKLNKMNQWLNKNNQIIYEEFPTHDKKDLDKYLKIELLEFNTEPIKLGNKINFNLSINHENERYKFDKFIKYLDIPLFDEWNNKLYKDEELYNLLDRYDYNNYDLAFVKFHKELIENNIPIGLRYLILSNINNYHFKGNKVYEKLSGTTVFDITSIQEFINSGVDDITLFNYFKIAEPNYEFIKDLSYIEFLQFYKENKLDIDKFKDKININWILENSNVTDNQSIFGNLFYNNELHELYSLFDINHAWTDNETIEGDYIVTVNTPEGLNINGIALMTVNKDVNAKQYYTKFNLQIDKPNTYTESNEKVNDINYSIYDATVYQNELELSKDILDKYNRNLMVERPYGFIKNNELYVNKDIDDGVTISDMLSYFIDLMKIKNNNLHNDLEIKAFKANKELEDYIRVTKPISFLDFISTQTNGIRDLNHNFKDSLINNNYNTIKPMEC